MASETNKKRGQRPDSSRKYRFVSQDKLPAKRAIRRHQLLEIVPLSHTTIYEMELKGEFPSRFYLTGRCAAWDLEEVLAWLAEKQAETRLHKPDLTGLPGIGAFNAARS